MTDLLGRTATGQKVVGYQAGAGGDFAILGSNAVQLTGSALTRNVTLDGTSAGSLIVLWLAWESASQVPTVVSVEDDQSNSFTIGTHNIYNGASNTGEPSGVFAWLLSNPSAGNRTYTATFSGTNNTAVGLHAWEFSAPGTVSKDQEASTAQAKTHEFESAQITTAGAPVVVIGGMGNWGIGTLSNWKIGGSTEGVTYLQDVNGMRSSWVKATTLSNGTAYVYSTRWIEGVTSIISFKAE
jgi:hypothetical protein